MRAAARHADRQISDSRAQERRWLGQHDDAEFSIATQSDFPGQPFSTLVTMVAI
jgi:hypothetical protein